MTRQWDETPERDMTEKDYGDECLIQGRRCLHADICYLVDTGNHCVDKVNGCPQYIPPCAITLPALLQQHYTERSQSTGKPVSQLVLQDLAVLHRKRVAKEEKRVWKEIEYERL